jgi:hypothetical protein
MSNRTRIIIRSLIAGAVEGLVLVAIMLPIAWFAMYQLAKHGW